MSEKEREGKKTTGGGGRNLPPHTKQGEVDAPVPIYETIGTKAYTTLLRIVLLQT